MDVKGNKQLRPPNFRISCSFERLWIIAPALKNNNALKKAWFAKWNKLTW